MKSLAFVLLVVALHVSLASLAASRHLLRSELSVPMVSCDLTR
ncbi:MAG: hypothetical protein ACREI8_10565 [Myxococcota bacterium]|jgi:hypothetical protein